VHRYYLTKPEKESKLRLIIVAFSFLLNPSSSTTTGPLISRGKPTYCASNNIDPGGPGAIVKGQYRNRSGDARK
jgi:hypothetical protein